MNNNLNLAVVLFIILGILYSTRLVKKDVIRWKHKDAIEQYHILTKNLL